MNNKPTTQQKARVRSYRVAFWHRAGHLVVRHVEAPNKVEAVNVVRSQFPAMVFGRLSSVSTT